MGGLTPHNRKILENRLKARLIVFGGDSRVFICSLGVCVPGAWRDGNLQRLVWLES